MPLRAALLASVLPLMAGVPAALAEEGSLRVALDRAQVVRIEREAETIIVGNPSIVDVAIHDARTLILTGRSYGVTNLVVLDGQGDAVIDRTVTVGSVESASVRVYRQALRSTYSCNPSCEPTVTIGDNDEAFSAAAGQFGTREGLARSQ
ncbi:pilus assembly protein N-terminal domain-containing protein [Aureimonas populi]|uniref:Pilus assembly protein N-terminal domain-containing protein n=1 Tax=Aureimonas populi TaxID=1701758 RepID=A0ABW5CKV6_9HYPH|nr:pilus assembly protein N-terminal domain-containing protein [Aureimonas populi]